MSKSLPVLEWGKRVAAFIIILIGCIVSYEVFVPKQDWIAGNSIKSGGNVSITSGTIIEQSFIAQNDHLSGLQILFAKDDKEYPAGATITWELVNPYIPETPLASGVIDISAIINGQLFAIQFPEIKESFFTPYILRLKTDLPLEGISIPRSPLTQSAGLTLWTNGTVQQGTLAFNLGFTRDVLSLPIFLLLLGTAIFLWWALLKRRKIWNTLNSTPLYKSVPILIAIFGLCFLIAVPPLQMPDEELHFRRAWDVSNGVLIPTLADGVVSTRLPEYIQAAFDRISRGDRTSHNPVQMLQLLFEPSGNPDQISTITSQSSPYNFSAYLLPALFIRLGVLLGSSALGLFLLGRLASLLLYIFLTTWALKNAKIGKYSIAVMALLGFVVTQGTAMSIDSLIMAGGFLFLSSVINLAFAVQETRKALRSEIWGLIVGAFCILIAKFVYLPLLALVLLIPASKFGTARNKMAAITIFGLAAVALTLGIYLMLPQGIDPRIDNTKVNMGLQVANLLDSPLTWLHVVNQTLNIYAMSYYVQFTWINGSSESMGLFSIAQIILILLFAWSESRDMWNKLRIWHYFIIGLVALLTLMAIYLPLYLTWTPVGADRVLGTQGRYLIPVFTLLLMTLKPAFIGIRKSFSALLILSMGFLLFNQLWMTLVIFY